MKSENLKSLLHCVCGLLISVAGSQGGKAATVPAGFTDSLVASGLSNPTNGSRP
jgi:hypothetical protein